MFARGSITKAQRVPPLKKKKDDKEETQLQDKANTSAQPPAGKTEFLFEFSEDEDEKKDRLVNGDANSSEVYFCKHCDYSDVNIKHVSAHYQNDHPYIRYNAVYIQDPCDWSATFRCLQCPVEFSSVADLKRHYTENHPEGPDIFTMHSGDLCLVFKCFVCPFTTGAVKELKDHYKERHPTHEVDNSLTYCRYSVNRCQEGPPQLDKFEKAPGPEKPQLISHDSAHTSPEEVKNAPSPQHATSKRADVSVYRCKRCNFCHKSVVVMHVHYQKSHPDEVVTIDKIKQSGCVTSPTALQMTAEKSPKAVPIKAKSTSQKNISDSSKETGNKAEEIPLSLANPTHMPEASKTHSASAQSDKLKSAEDRSKVKKSPTKRKREMFPGMDGLSSDSPNELFYCQFCSFSGTKVKSVVGHHNAKHATDAPINTEEVLAYSFEMRKKILQSETEASTRTTTSVSKNRKVEVYDKNKRKEEVGAADALVAAYNPYACAEKLYYCQKCNYGNPSPQGVVNHQVKVHHNIRPNLKHVFEHTALIRDEMEKSKAKDSSFSSRLPLPLMVEGEEDVFFCHFCNYRHRNLKKVLWHYVQKHNGFVVKSEEIQRYTSVVLKETKKSQLKTTGKEVSRAFVGNNEIPKKKTKKLGKVSASPSIRALQTQRTLPCHRCPYSTQYVYMLRRHMWNIHKSNRSSAEVLRACFKRGNLETGYYCDLCVFSHSKAIAVYEHYQEQHPGRRLSLEYVSTRLYVGPKQTKPQTKQPDGTDSCSSTQRSEQSENKKYSCRACSYKGSSLSSITRHYRAFHPWSVKEDGSVLYLINNKKRSANRQVEDPNEMPQSFDTYQVPLEFEKSLDSSPQAASSQQLKCPFCPAMFCTKRGYKTHCGMKHQGAENLDKEKEEQVQTQPRVHVFKCRHCTYVNTSYQGVLTHCQMRHPALESLADSLHVEASVDNWEDCVKRKGPGLRLSGYMCKSCPQIYKTQEKLSKHCEEDHDESVANILPKKSKSAPELSAVSKTKHHKIHNQGSVSKASFLNRNRHAVVRCQYCSYSCSTKFVLARHLQVRHKTSSVSKARDCFYKCLLCSKLYFKKKRLGHHYANKHGKDAFLKYYAPFYKEVHKKPAEAVPDSPLNQHNIPEACESSTTAEENKKLVFKCPKCPYVNSSYHGTLTHCQMKHPELTARADELQTLEIFVSNMVRCTLGKASNVRGYMCKRCPQIHVSLKKLKIHCERDHNQAKKRDASKHSVECETEQRPETGFQGSILEAFTLKIKTSSTGTTEIGSSQQLDTHESLPSNSLLLQDKKSVYKCHVCTYAGSCRKYLYCHYKNTHKLDAYTTYKLLEKYNKYKHKSRNVAETKSKDIAHAKCKLCPNLTFNSSQQLISHYSTLHLSDSILNFTVLNQASKRTTGLYRCSLCKKQMNGTRILCYHLDRHRDKEKNSAKTARASDKVITPPTKSVALGEQDELPMLETVEDLAQWNVTPVETFTVPPSSPLSPPNPSDPEQPELESKEDKLACKQCGRTFMSLKGLRSHERSHATLAAIKKQSTLSTSALKHDINKYVLYKDGNLRPFLCSICSYRTTVLSLWKSHFMKKHRDVVMDRAETDGQDEESAHMANEERPNSSDELNNLPELDNEPKSTEESLYLEPPDVQRQLNHYSLMAQASTISKTNVEEAKLPDNSLLPCEFCNFNTGHLSSVRRHYLNRHGKKMLRCKDCNFFTGIRKTLEMHIDKGHSTCQSEPTHQKDLRCPFCLYQTKNKNNMIDHVVLHREERVVPIEVRRPKLSRYLQDLVFRCHKCTFTSGSAEMLRLHMMKHDDIKPYKCRLCYFDCPQLKDLEAHLNDKHQVMRNHELVGQVSLDQLEASVCRMPEEEAEHLSDMEHQNDDSEDIKTEEFDTRCNEVLNETQAKNPPENNIGENTLMPKEGFQSKGQDGENGKREREECPAECSVLDIQYEDKKTITTDQDKQDTQERETVLFSQYEDYNFPEKYGQTNKNQTKLRVGEDTSVTFTQLKQRSTTSGNTLEEAQVHKLDFRGQKHRMMNVEDKIEDDILRHVLQLDEDGNNYKLHKKLHWDKTVKMEQNIEPEVTDNVLNGNVLYNEQGSITVANSQQIQAPTNAISTSAKMNYSEANRVRAHEPLTFERNLLTLGPNFGQLKIGHKGILGVSFRKGKEKQIQTQNNSTEVRDTYGEMPVLEKERLKEEMHPFSWCKEEDWSNQSDQKEDKKEEMVSEDVKTEEGDGIENARSLHVPEGAVSNGETTQEKLFTCEFCGRILMNSSELEHHIIRHGI